MRCRWWLAGLCAVFCTVTAFGAAKVHVIAFGKWMTVQWAAGAAGLEKAPPIKVRGLIVDGRVKEYVTGVAHDVTDRLFVVRRAFRVNDSLPTDAALRWQWERGGWLLVDRLTGRISPINLPEFDPFYSAATWYRDYVAYCGIGDDGKKMYAVVAQVSRRKALLKKQIGEAVPEDVGPDSLCPAPEWQRSPARVSFDLPGGKQTYAIRGHVVDVVEEDDEE